jgi:hypothetical protein
MLLDSFLPVYEFNEIHTTTIHASPERVFRSLKELTFAELSPVVSALFAIRALPARLTGKGNPFATEARPFLEELLDNDFVLLAEEPNHELVFGLVGQFWKLSADGGLKLADAQAFFAFDDPDYAKAVANFYLDENAGNGRIKISTETRIHVPDPATRKKFAAYWRVIYPGSALIRMMWLKAIKRRAERRLD